MADTADTIAITCPRCGGGADVRFYGPCSECREQLRASVGSGPGAAASVERFEPKMHVTVNAVALRDD